jgi:hypothetical protein
LADWVRLSRLFFRVGAATDYSASGTVSRAYDVFFRPTPQHDGVRELTQSAGWANHDRRQPTVVGREPLRAIAPVAMKIRLRWL